MTKTTKARKPYVQHHTAPKATAIINGRKATRVFHYSTGELQHPFNFNASPVLYGYIRSRSASPAVINGRLYGFLVVSRDRKAPAIVTRGRFVPLGHVDTPIDGRGERTPAVPVTDSASLAYAVMTGRVDTDAPVSSLQKIGAFDMDETRAGIRATFHAWRSDRFAGVSGTLSGRSMFVYAGHSMANELLADNGAIYWLCDVHMDEASEAIVTARRVAMFARTDDRHVCGIRRPRTIAIEMPDPSAPFSDPYDPNVCEPESTTDYADATEPRSAPHVASRMRSLRVRLARMLREWREAGRAPYDASKGARYVHRPFAVRFARYGYAIRARRADDRRMNYATA